MSEAPAISDMVRVDYGGRELGPSVARFSCQIDGVRLLGLRLNRDAAGRFCLGNPMRKGGAARTALGAIITDDALRAEILAAAIVALDAVPELVPDGHRKVRGRRMATV